MLAVTFTALSIALLALAPSIILTDGIGWRDLLTVLIVLLSIAQAVGYIRQWWVSRRADLAGEHPSDQE